MAILKSICYSEIRNNKILQREVIQISCFVGGVIFGTAGIKILSSKDAKKVYVNCTAAALRAKDCVMQTATTIQENAEDILAEAQQINEKRAEDEAMQVMEDEVQEDGAPEQDKNEQINDEISY